MGAIQIQRAFSSLFRLFQLNIGLLNSNELKARVGLVGDG
jgi:hypothetical protein